MRPNRVKQRWREGKDVRAAWTLTGDPLTVEIMAHAGFDAILIDMQHGFTIGPERVGTLLHVISTTEAVPLVRVLPKLAFHLDAWVVMHEDLRAVNRIRLVFDHLVAQLAAYAAHPRKARSTSAVD